jgi:cysteine desulfurase / selenocysteine lyase
MQPSSPSPALDVASLRAREFPFVSESVYLNAASVTPLPVCAARAIAAHQAKRERIHELSHADFAEPLRRSRAAAAALVGAGEDEIALGWNTSYGINLAALGLAGAFSGRVVSSEREFPANVYPWMGLEDRELELVPVDAHGWPDEARLRERLERPGVGVLALSSVQFASGYQADLERLGSLCRERGILFVVDGIQSVGSVPMDVVRAKIDVLACGGHKWLLGPFGTGFAYVRRELHERLRPRVIGWTGMEASEDISSLTDYRWGWKRGAQRYEVATLPFQDFAGFAASLELLLETGVERIAAHREWILQPLTAWLEENPWALASDPRPGRRSGIVALRPRDPEATAAALHEAGVIFASREGAIRLSPHLYNIREEIERVVEILSRTGRA